MPVLTGIDVLGIQRYIFVSNRLRDALAASWTVERVTGKDFLKGHGVRPAAILLAAGGNAVLEFASEDEAKRWTSHYTRALYEEAPGLEVAVAHRPYEKGGLARALETLQAHLARVKLARRPTAAQLGLSVTAPCAITGLPAAGSESGEPLSRQILALRRKQGKARERWRRFLPLAPSGAEFEFPLELDHLGRSREETSLVGVVHVDGNGIGSRIQEWLERRAGEPECDERVREEYREWSGALIALGKRVLEILVQRVAGCIVPATDGAGGWELRGTPQDLAFQLHCKDRTIALPLRPVLLGGDDLTFLCDGRIALDLAAAALREFQAATIPHLGEDGGELKPTACAGVAIVRAHSPFHRGYELAEKLTREAKRARKRQLEENPDADIGWLDWHIGPPRPGEGVKQLRERQYRRRIDGRESTLTLRPYPLQELDGRSESWEWLDTELLGPQTGSHPPAGFRGVDSWTASRHRVKELAALVGEGPEAVERQVEAWRLVDPGLALPGGLRLSGYVGSCTPLLDAVELLDIHMRLEAGEQKANAAPGADQRKEQQ